jgi:hypothetical protein
MPWWRVVASINTTATSGINLPKARKKNLFQSWGPLPRRFLRVVAWVRSPWKRYSTTPATFSGRGQSRLKSGCWRPETGHTTNLSFPKAWICNVSLLPLCDSRNAKTNGTGIVNLAACLPHSPSFWVLLSHRILINKLLTGLFVADCVSVSPFKGVQGTTIPPYNLVTVTRRPTGTNYRRI